MIVLIIFLIICLLFVSFCLFVSVKRNFQLLDKLEDIDQVLIESLKILEVQHQKIEVKSKIEIFSDEPVIRDLIEDISIAKSAVKNVADILKELEETINVQEEDDDEKETNR